MIGAFSSLKSLLTVNPVAIDNGIFVLHYKVTVLVLLVCTIMVSSLQHFGDPITCLSDNNIKDVKFGKAVDSYCWVYSTYTVNQLIDEKIGNNRVLRPGVGQHNKNTTQKFIKYYQFVGFFLLFQAWTFYFPRFLWKLWEGGKMRDLTLNFQNQLNFQDKELIARRKIVAKYLLRNFHRNNYYASRYLICEILNLLNVVAQIALTDLFLGHEFSTYGTDVISFMYEGIKNERTDPMERLFPKLAKCTFNQFGPSGSIVPYDLLCVLQLNSINEKVFIFLWLWYFTLALVSLLGIIYRISTILIAPIRRCRLRSKARLCESVELKILSKYCYFGDWFVLIQLSKNMDCMIYADLLKDIALKLKKNGVGAIRYQYSASTKGLSRPASNLTIVNDIGSNFNSEPLYDCVP